MKTLSISKKVSKYSEVLRFMKTAFPSNEQMPIWLLKLLAWQRGVNFNAYYDESSLCGISYTVENKTMVFGFNLVEQRKNRIRFYQKNGIEDTGYTFADGGEVYSVLSSDPAHFQPKEYERLLKKFSLGLYRKKISAQ